MPISSKFIEYANNLQFNYHNILENFGHQFKPYPIIAC